MWIGKQGGRKSVARETRREKEEREGRKGRRRTRTNLSGWAPHNMLMFGYCTRK